LKEEKDPFSVRVMKAQWLIGSIAIHSLMLAALLSFAPRLTSVENQKLVEVEFLARPKKSESFAKNAESTSGTRSRGTKAVHKKVNLFDSSYTHEAFIKNDEILGSPPANDFKDSETYVFDAKNILADTDQWEFYHQIFERIDSQLLFDSLLAQYKHFGTVFLEFTVDAQGHFVEQGLKASAQDPILKVHVMRAVRKGLLETFRKEKWNPSGKSAVLQAKFDFLFGSSEDNFNKQKDFGKPVLVFKRATLEKPIPNDLAEHLMSGGIDYDFFAMAERWQKYNKKKKLRAGEFDPFILYRKDRDYDL